MRIRCLLWLMLAFVAAATAVAVGDPRTAWSASTNERLQEAESGLERQRRRGGVLTTELAALRSRLQAATGRLVAQRARLEDASARAARARARQAALQEALRASELRLARLRDRLARGRALLARRLVALYQADDPDLLTVALEADGFAELLERVEFARRIGEQDRRVMRRVARDRDAAAIEVRRLGRLEREQATIARELASELAVVRTATSAIRGELDRLEATRAERRRRLRAVRVRQRDLDRRVDVLRRAQARTERRLAAAQASVTPGPRPKSPGGWRWPISGTVTSPFCESRSWEACHPGVDIAAPSGTAIRAARSGRVMLLQAESASGGYGNFTCLDHGGGVSSCYAHQTSFAVSAGQAVSGGQVIGTVGSTGRSTGPHLHFEVRVNGGVVNPFDYL